MKTMSEIKKNNLKWLDLGLMDFDCALTVQQQFHKKCLLGELRGVFLKIEHPDVLTFGKNSLGFDDLLFDENFYVNKNIKLIICLYKIFIIIVAKKSA